MNDLGQKTDTAATADAGSQKAPPLSFINAMLATPVGPVGQISHDWRWRDWFGAAKMRLDIGRLAYAIPPGLYASGKPSAEAPVLVTANYKLTVDVLRRAIAGIDAWLLVLDTRGINVWCAAGKGTFGTTELVNRIAVCRLPELVSHRTIIVPQLGAPGIAAHQVLAASGFRVVYGPVRAHDLPKFLQLGMQASQEMRTVTFNLAERLTVVPVEIMHWGKWLAAIIVAAAASAALGAGNVSLPFWGASALRLLIAFAGGALLGPALFPWLPGRAFAAKGAFSGLLALAIMLAAGLLPMDGLVNKLQTGGWALLTLSISSFLMLSYTGSSPYTSFSGTQVETRIGIRLQWAAGIAGMALLILPMFFERG